MATLVKILRQMTEGPLKQVLVEFNGPASYPNTGSTVGDPIQAVSIGLSSIEDVELIGVAVDSAGLAQRKVSAVLPLQTPGATNAGGPKGFSSMKVIWSDLDGTQAANASDQSAYRARMVVRGNGS